MSVRWIKVYGVDWRWVHCVVLLTVPGSLDQSWACDNCLCSFMCLCFFSFLHRTCIWIGDNWVWRSLWMCVFVCVVPSSVYSCFMHSVPTIGSESTMTLTRIKSLLKMTEWMSQEMSNDNNVSLDISPGLPGLDFLIKLEFPNLLYFIFNMTLTLNALNLS